MLMAQRLRIDQDRTKQIWTYRADKVGELTLGIRCGVVSKTFSLTITESSMDIGAETQDLSLYLSSYGRSNNEAAEFGHYVSGRYPGSI